MPAGKVQARRRPDPQRIAAWLESVTDPEIPVLTITDLGILRDVQVHGGRVEVVITPTYSGCPAMETIEQSILVELARHGIDDVRVRQQLSPAWTTDWLTPQGRRKLRDYGIAPPVEASADKKTLTGGTTVVCCPQCGSTRTARVSEFGSTACKALYRCEECLEPFDYFKCL